MQSFSHAHLPINLAHARPQAATSTSPIHFVVSIGRARVRGFGRRMAGFHQNWAGRVWRIGRHVVGITEFSGRRRGFGTCGVQDRRPVAVGGLPSTPPPSSPSTATLHLISPSAVVPNLNLTKCSRRRAMGVGTVFSCRHGWAENFREIDFFRNLSAHGSIKGTGGGGLAHGLGI